MTEETNEKKEFFDDTHEKIHPGTGQLIVEKHSVKSYPMEPLVENLNQARAQVEDLDKYIKDKKKDLKEVEEFSADEEVTKFIETQLKVAKFKKKEDLIRDIAAREEQLKTLKDLIPKRLVLVEKWENWRAANPQVKSEVVDQPAPETVVE